MTNTINIGRTQFNKDNFINIAKESTTLKEIAEKLNLNSSVPTHIGNIKNQINALNINTDHMKKFTITDRIIESGQERQKDFDLSEINQVYYDAFKEKFGDKKSSWLQYKVHCGAFLESLNNIDFALVTPENIENYSDNASDNTKTQANCKAHIRSMMIYIVQNNIKDAFDKVSKEMLVYLI